MAGPRTSRAISCSKHGSRRAAQVLSRRFTITLRSEESVAGIPMSRLGRGSSGGSNHAVTKHKTELKGVVNR